MRAEAGVTDVRVAREIAMATRPIWRGHLRLALVSCPVALHSVKRASGDLHFHYINPETGHRVRMVMLDAETDEEVARRDLVRGYEFQKDHYVLMEEEDFEKARIESSSVLTVSKFVDRDDIAPIYFDASYYMVPDGDAGQDVYVVLRDAIAATGRAALSRVVIAQRERPVAIMPMGKGLVCHTLHEPRDLNDAAPLFDEITRDRADPDMVKLARQLIDRQVGEFKPADTEDRYETRLRDVIDAKLKGEGIEPEPPDDEDRGNVIDLMAALKASLSKSAPSASEARHSDNEPPRRAATPARKAPRKSRATKQVASKRKRA
jgi:DNA end-binding protein Ku